jgi:zinc transporter, ZIP family
VSTWLLAGLVGLLAGVGLVLGALIGYSGRVRHRAVAVVMGFGAGVLVAVLTLELVAEARERGSTAATAGGFLLGALVFSTINWRLEHRGAAQRKRCGECVAQPTESEVPGSGLAIAVGALIDGIPESMAIGLSVASAEGSRAVHATSVSVALIGGFFMANVPQGLSGASGMRDAGRSLRYVIAVWGTVVAASTLAAIAGAVVVADAGVQILAGLVALAAGGVMAMLAETMIPEAFHLNRRFIGVITATGFVAAVILGTGVS